MYLFFFIVFLALPVLFPFNSSFTNFTHFHSLFLNILRLYFVLSHIAVCSGSKKVKNYAQVKINNLKCELYPCFENVTLRHALFNKFGTFENEMPRYLRQRKQHEDKDIL
jgi:hypothetical protein